MSDTWSTINSEYELPMKDPEVVDFWSKIEVGQISADRLYYDETWGWSVRDE